VAVAVLNKVWPVKARGATIQFSSSFFDADGNDVQPLVAQVRVTYTLAAGGSATVILQMAQAATGEPWIAQWDSRGAAAGTVYWSLETPGSPPVAVEDGQLTLISNSANVPTF
jgi:hypothetical protein